MENNKFNYVFCKFDKLILYIYNQLSSYLTLFSIDDEYNIESFNFIDS